MRCKAAGELRELPIAPGWAESLRGFTDDQLRAELERRRLSSCEEALRKAGVPEEFWRA